MGIIGKSVKMCHLVGIAIVLCICMYNIPMGTFYATVGVAADGGLHASEGALTVVESNSESDKSDDGDGIVTIEASDDDIIEEEPHSLFEATSDWKPVKKGQKIPHGLHVRLNLQTGEREAKLMDKPNKKQMNEWYAGEKMGTINTERQRFTRDEIKKALKDFKFDDSQLKTGKPEQADKEVNDIKKKFRSYEELKQEMKQMKMSVKTEAEIVTELLDKVKDPETDAERTNTHLIDLEYYLHQIDNARLFCDLGGMQLFLKLMNHSKVEIRSQSLLALGAALQSNSKAQVNAVDNGVLHQLVRMISVDESLQVKKKSLFALSTLLRQFPFAQSQFLKAGGLSAVTSVFSKSDDEMLRIKIVTLLTDLVQEKDLISDPSVKASEIHEEKSRQYSEVQMRAALHKSGWCTHLSSLLHQNSGHDDVEKIVSAMTILKDTCQDQFSSVRPVLQSLSSHYLDLAKIDEEQGEKDTFFNTIHNSIERLLKEIRFQREDL